MKRVGIVTSRFNSEITEKLEEGAISILESVDGLEIFALRVPGAVEIPLACQALFEQGCEGVVALGAVIRGETSHYDVVCNSVERGVTALMLQYKKPIGFGVLTTENEEQALERVGGKHGHKGSEAAQVMLEMMGLLEQVKIDLAPEKKSAKKAIPKAKKPVVAAKGSAKTKKKASIKKKK